MIQLRRCAVDPTTGEVDGGPHLTQMERALLAYLAARPGQAVSRRELLTDVWGYSQQAATRTVDATMNRLRAKVELDPATPDHLLTVWGTGYQFEPGPAAPDRSGSEPFFGRSELLDELDRRLGRSRLVTLTGVAGIGKTHTARRFAETTSGHYPGGIRFCDLTAATDQADLVAALARVTIPVRQADDEGMGRIAESLGGALLVLDNAEHLVDEVAATATSLLAANATVRVLVTSRERLRLREEWVVELGPLGPGAATALLKERVEALGIDLSDEQAEAIATRVDRIPLALELAAGLLDVLTVDGLLAKLAEPLDALSSDARDRPEAHRSLRAALDRSVQMLTSAERSVLAGLSVFRGDFTVAAAEQVLGDGLLGTLRSLRRKSLVHRAPTGRLGLYLPVRALASERLDGETSFRHCAWVLGELGRGFDRDGPPPEPADLRWLLAERDNVRAAWEWALHADDQASAQIAHALHHAYTRTGPIEQAIAVLDRTLEHRDADRLAGHLIRCRGQVRLGLRAWTEAEADLTRALAIADRFGDDRLSGRALSNMLSAALARADLARARALGEQAVAALERAGARASLAFARMQLSQAWSDEPDLAREMLDRALVEASEAGSSRVLGAVLARAGVVCAHGGDERAFDHLERAVALLRDAQDPLAEAYTLWSLGRALCSFDRHEEALVALGEAVKKLRAAGRDEPAPLAEIQALAHHAAGNPTRAAEALERALAGAKESPRFLEQLRAAKAIVEAQRRVGRGEDARNLLIGIEPAPDWAPFADRLRAHGP